MGAQIRAIVRNRILFGRTNLHAETSLIARPQKSSHTNHLRASDRTMDRATFQGRIRRTQWANCHDNEVGTYLLHDAVL